MLPAKDLFMLHYVDGYTGETVIICHSKNPEIFKFIGNAAAFIDTSRKNHTIVDDENIIKDNYWNEKANEAIKYGIPTISYLSIESLRLPERNAEYEKMVMKSVENIKFTNLIKESMIKAKKSIIYKVKQFLEKDQEKNISNERE